MSVQLPTQLYSLPDDLGTVTVSQHNLPGRVLLTGRGVAVHTTPSSLEEGMKINKDAVHTGNSLHLSRVDNSQP